MKQKLLNSIRLRAMMLVAVMCAAFAGQAWATDPTWSHVFASPEAISSNSITVDGATWTVSTTAGAGSPTISTGNSNSKYGLKFGSNKSTYYGSVTFSTDYFKNYNVKSVSVTILNNGSKSGTLTAVQGDASIGSTSQTFGQAWTTLTVNTKAGSGGTLSFTYSVEQAFYINSITVTYEDNGGGGGSTVDAPSFSPEAGAVTAGTTITLTQTTADEIRYTIDGTDPTKTTGTVYSAPIEITTATTIKAIAVEGDDVSDVATASYTISVATPEFNLDSNGSYLSGTGVTLTSANTIYYNMTTDGSTPDDPTSSSTEYAGPISLSSGTVKIKAIAYDAYDNASSVVSRTINGVNPTTLPFNWAGGVKATLTALDGVVGYGLGSDYAESHSQYRVKFDNDGDYIEVFTNAQPLKVSVGVKMIGGNTSSKIKVQESTNGVAFTDVEELTIEGSTNDIVNLETTGDFAATTRVIKLLFVKGDNVGVGPIRITKYTVGPDIDVTDSDVELAGDATSGEIEYSIVNPDGVSSLTASSTTDWISNVTVDSENSKVTFTTTANDGEEREGTITLSYPGAENKVVTVTQAEKVVTLTYSPAASITSGKHYIITNGTSGTVKAMGAQRDSNRGSVDVTIDAGNISFLSNAGVAELIIYGPDADGYYTIYDGTGYLYAASSSANNLKTKADIDNNARWSIEIDGNATIKAQGNYTRNLMRNNGDLFSCYSSGQNAVYLYEKAGEATPTESVTVTSVGYATYASNNALDFSGSGINAYIAKADGTTGVTFTQVDKVPANTGVLLYADGGATVDIPSLTGAASKVSGNVFLPGTGEAVASVDGSLHNYILNKPSEKPIGFYRAAGQTVAKNRAYIQIDESTPVKGFIALPGSEETAVKTVKAEAENGVIFNLAGQRVQKLQRGINIVNGRKVVVK